MSTDNAAAKPGVVLPTPRPAPIRVGACGVVLIAIWIGLIAGVGDVALLVAKRRWFDPTFFVWEPIFPGSFPRVSRFSSSYPRFSWLRSPASMGLCG